jgi:hypothetical protein
MAGELQTQAVVTAQKSSGTQAPPVGKCEEGTQNRERPMNHHYIRLAAMAALSFLSMYALMYAMVDRLQNVYPSSTSSIWPD